MSDEALKPEVPECNHLGFWNPTSTTVMDLGDKLLLVTTTNCRNCNHITADLKPIKLTAGPSIPQTGILKP